MRLENRLQAIKLFLLLRQNINLVSLLDMLLQIFRQYIELLMEERLRDGIEGNLAMRRKRALLVDLDGLQIVNS